jgi:hypothetical protein
VILALMGNYQPAKIINTYSIQLPGKLHVRKFTSFLTYFLRRLLRTFRTIRSNKQGKEAPMLNNNQELQGKINDFIRRKQMQYPELSDSVSNLVPRRTRY